MPQAFAFLVLIGKMLPSWIKVELHDRQLTAKSSHRVSDCCRPKGSGNKKQASARSGSPAISDVFFFSRSNRGLNTELSSSLVITDHTYEVVY